MRVMVGLDGLEPAEKGSAVTIGTFDGLHVGHRALIERAVAVARQQDLVATVVTWDRHPFVTLRPDRVPALLTTQERRAELIEATGVDALAVLAFDAELSSWAAERFAAEVLTKGLGAREVVVGDGWRFGHGAAGDVSLLGRLGDDLGFGVQVVDLSRVAGDAVSSSRVRTGVVTGDMELAATLLGRPYDIDGRVVRGAGRGADLGYRTANLAVDTALVLPARGAYAGRARARGLWYPAAISVGIAPTFGGDSAVTVEAHLLDFDGDLYGSTVRVELWQHLHDDIAFESAAELVQQIDADVATTRGLFPDDPP